MDTTTMDRNLIDTIAQTVTLAGKDYQMIDDGESSYLVTPQAHDAGIAAVEAAHHDPRDEDETEEAHAYSVYCDRAKMIKTLTDAERAALRDEYEMEMADDGYLVRA